MHLFFLTQMLLLKKGHIADSQWHYLGFIWLSSKPLVYKDVFPEAPGQIARAECRAALIKISNPLLALHKSMATP